MMHAWRAGVGVLLSLSLLAVPADGAAPANDTCAGAQIVPASGPFPFLTIPVEINEATTTGDPFFSACGSLRENSVWYTFTPAESGLYTLSTAASATKTTVDKTMVVIFTSTGGCAGTFTVVPTVDGVTRGCEAGGAYAEPGHATLTTQLTGGTQYFIGIWTVGLPPLTPKTSTVQMQVERNLTPLCDTCAGAIALMLNVPKFGTTKGATNDYQLNDNACFAGAQQTPVSATGRDTVYSFTAPATDTYEIKVAGKSHGTNPVLYTSTSCPAATPGIPVSVTCAAASNRSVETTAERVVLTINAGETRYIFIDDSQELPDNFGLDYYVQVTPIALESETNDTPATSDTIACGIGFDLGTNSDLDFFSLGAVADQSRLFAMVDGSAVNGIDIDMRVTTTTSTLEYDRAGGSFPFGENSPVIAGTILGTASHYLRINRNEADQIIPGYRVYSLIEPSISSATAESEPNDTTGTADAATNNYFSGTLAGPAPSIDVDFYRTDANAGEGIFVAVDGDPLRNNTPIVAKVALLDPDGHVLAEVNDPRNTSSTTSGTGSLSATTPSSPAQALLFRAPVAGTYSVRVEIGTPSTGTIGTGDYLLAIGKTCTAGGGSSTTLGIDTVSPPAGTTAGGQTITLTGNFENLSSVKLGDTVAPILTTSPTEITVTAPAHTAGATSITLTPTSGGTYIKPNAFAYLSTTFTDEPAVAAVTKVKASHILELRSAVDTLRVVAGLSAASWTDSSPSFVKATHIHELRTLLEDAAARLGYAADTYTDPSLTSGTLIRAVHINELRERIETIAN